VEDRLSLSHVIIFIPMRGGGNEEYNDAGEAPALPGRTKKKDECVVGQAGRLSHVKGVAEKTNIEYRTRNIE
jgi:hypothetical protein